MREQGPRPIVDAEELAWFVRLVLVAVAMCAAAMFVGVLVGLFVVSFRFVIGGW